MLLTFKMLRWRKLNTYLAHPVFNAVVNRTQLIQKGITDNESNISERKSPNDH